jgi:transcriptional regulator with XRE-family HTH domain
MKVFNDLNAEFGAIVRRLRKARGMTQDELARKTCLSRVAIANLELGRQGILLNRIYGLAAALGVEPQCLLPHRSEPDPEDAPPDPLLKSMEILKSELESARASLAERDKILAYISYHVRKWQAPD